MKDAEAVHNKIKIIMKNDVTNAGLFWQYEYIAMTPLKNEMMDTHNLLYELYENRKYARSMLVSGENTVHITLDDGFYHTDRARMDIRSEKQEHIHLSSLLGGEHMSSSDRVSWSHTSCGVLNSRVSVKIHLFPQKCGRFCNQLTNMIEQFYYDNFINVNNDWISENDHVDNYVLPLSAWRIDVSEIDLINASIIDMGCKKANVFLSNIGNAIFTTMKKREIRSLGHKDSDLAFKIFMQNDSCQSECQILKLQFTVFSYVILCEPLSCKDLPIYIPPTHINCMLAETTLSLLAYPTTHNRSCEANSHNIKIESISTRKMFTEMSALSNPDLEFHPICNISIIPYEYFDDSMTQKTNPCSVERTPAGNIPRLYTWEEAHRACWERNESLPSFNSFQEMSRFIQTLHKRWTTDMFYPYSYGAENECEAHIYHEVAIYLGLKKQV